MADSSDEENVAGIFEEPEGFYQPEKEPTFVKHRMLNGDELTLRLVGHNPLWVGGNSIVSVPYCIRQKLLHLDTDDSVPRATSSGTRAAP